MELVPSPGRLLVQMTVQRELPAEWSEALSAGAPVGITYRLRLYRNRHWLCDQRVAAHELVVKAQRDPLTGVFTLVAELDGEILASGQVGCWRRRFAGSRTAPVGDNGSTSHGAAAAVHACRVSDALQAPGDSFDRRDRMVPVRGPGVAVSDLRRRWQRYRRQNRFLVGLYVGLLVLAGAGYALFSAHGRPPAGAAHQPLADLPALVVRPHAHRDPALHPSPKLPQAGSGTALRHPGVALPYQALALVPGADPGAHRPALPIEHGALLGRGLGVVLRAGGANGPRRRGARGWRPRRGRNPHRAGGTGHRRAVACDPLTGCKAGRARAPAHRIGDQLTGWLRKGIPVVELVDPRQRVLQRLAPLPPRL